jgi:hypothetical protein
MINDAEEQEFREALIAYFLLWQEGGEEGWTKEQLDGRAESWLREVAGIEVDFEDEDSLNKLSRLGLATVEHHRWQVVPLDQADQILTQYSSE